jgi:L-cystine uptake protein TcyP (sodium:dicarboxylate symporter family)
VTIDQKSIGVQLVVMPLVCIAYFAVVLTRLADASVEEISWVVPMIWAMGAIIVGIIVGTIATAIGTYVRAEARGEEAVLESGDIRDKEIERLGDRKTQTFTSLGSLAVIVLAMTRVDHFWIASAVFLAGTIGAIYGNVVKLRAYRRGF